MDVIGHRRWKPNDDRDVLVLPAMRHSFPVKLCAWSHPSSSLSSSAHVASFSFPVELHHRLGASPSRSSSTTDIVGSRIRQVPGRTAGRAPLVRRAPPMAMKNLHSVEDGQGA
jgi:hypothetical protein